MKCLLLSLPQRLMAVKYKKRKLPPAAPLLQLQDKIATTQEINQVRRYVGKGKVTSKASVTW